jgi:Tfp pilus assembly protein PilN
LKFQINIYRPGRKPKKVPKPTGPTGEERQISVAILIPLMFLLLLGIIFVYMRTSTSLDRKMQMNRSQKTYLLGQLSKAKKDLAKVVEELELISRLQVKRVEWVQKLMDLSEIVPDDLWLTDLSMKTTKKQKRGSREVEEEIYLVIKGVTVSVLGRQPLDSIAKLISSLNSLESFQRDFDPATLVTYQLSREKGRELMEFEISSKLKERPGIRGIKREKTSK